MIRKKNEMLTEEREHMRGGAGTVALRHLFTGAELGPHARLTAQITLPPGASIGAHAHEGERELFYVISGEATLTENGQEYQLQQGDASITGQGGTHSVANHKNEPAVLMAVIIMD